MRLRNRSGRPIDPVPFLVVFLLTALFVFAFGPMYGLTLGYSLGSSLVVCAFLVAVVGAVTFHRMVWTVSPELHREVPAAARIERLYYGMIGLTLLVIALAFPFLPWR